MNWSDVVVTGPAKVLLLTWMKQPTVLAMIATPHPNHLAVLPDCQATNLRNIVIGVSQGKTVSLLSTWNFLGLHNAVVFQQL